MAVFMRDTKIWVFIAAVAAILLMGCFPQKPHLQDHSAQSRPDAVENFYAWANHDWLVQAKIPDDRPQMNNFVTLKNQLLDQQKVLLDELLAKKGLSEDQQKLAVVYRNLSDMKKRNDLGVTPINDVLQAVDAAKTHQDIVRLFAILQKQGVDIPLAYEVSADFMDSTSNVVFVGQSGLGLERELYLNDDDRSKKERTLYQAFVKTLFSLAGIQHEEIGAESVLALEVALAKIQWSNVDNRDIEKIYNKKDFKGLNQLSPQLWFGEQLHGLGIPQHALFNVMQPSYVTALGDVVNRVPVEQWQWYLKAHVLADYAPLLSDPFLEATAQYQINRGTYKAAPPQWQRNIDYVNRSIGMLMGKIYVERYFDSAKKALVVNITQDIVKEYRDAITHSQRLTPETKASALRKLDKMAFKVGYPDRWQDYRQLLLDDSNLVANHRAIVGYEFERNLAKLGKPVDKEEWVYPPQMINAYYDPTQNTFVLLAGILQAPFFEANATMAENFGGIGFVIGHEIGHGYDDSGARFDGDGNMNNWWHPQDAAAFGKLKAALIEQANTYPMPSGLKLNGPLEVGEIMGDLSGAEIAFAAYTRYAHEHQLDIDTAQKTFFMQLAKTWRSVSRDDYMAQLLESDPHPPSEFRTNGIVKNMDKFHELFDTKPGDAMYLAPEQRVHVW